MTPMRSWKGNELTQWGRSENTESQERLGPGTPEKKQTQAETKAADTKLNNKTLRFMGKVFRAE